MKKIFLYTLGLIFLISACSDEETEPSITVEGNATVKMPVAYVKFNVGLNERGEELQPLVQQSYQTMLDLKNLLLEEWNIPDSLVMTNESSVSKYRIDRNEFAFYFEQTMTVTLDSLELYETLRRDLIEAGATEAEIIYFGNFNSEKYKEKAWHQAYKNALKKAKGLASSAGLSIGEPQSINMGRVSITLDADFDLAIRGVSSISASSKVLESTLIKEYKKVDGNVRVAFDLE